MADHIVVTGAAGFIGSCLAHHLNKTQDKPLLLVDDFSFPEKNKNLVGLDAHVRIEREEFLNQLNDYSISAIFHIGARTDTTEFDTSIFEHLNVNYTKTLWEYATEKNIPFIYASSAATYGEGELGFDDDNSAIHKLKPLNPYGQSKQDIDQWILEQTKTPDFWVGLKFFNVFGPNEYHKGRMASVVMHAFNQLDVYQRGAIGLHLSRRFCHPMRLSPGKLHRCGGVPESQFRPLAHARLGLHHLLTGDHLTHHQPGAKTAHQIAERAIGDSGQRRQKNRGCQSEMCDLNGHVPNPCAVPSAYLTSWSNSNKSPGILVIIVAVFGVCSKNKHSSRVNCHSDVQVLHTATRQQTSKTLDHVSASTRRPAPWTATRAQPHGIGQGLTSLLKPQQAKTGFPGRIEGLAAFSAAALETA